LYVLLYSKAPIHRVLFKVMLWFKSVAEKLSSAGQAEMKSKHNKRRIFTILIYDLFDQPGQ
jgi:hypothetical protein